MSENNEQRERFRLYVTGSCDGLEEVLRGLETHQEIEFIGWSETVVEAADALTGGHLAAVLHATRGPSFPKNEFAAIREHTRAPVLLLASGEYLELLDEALEAGVADVIPAWQPAESVVLAIRKARHHGRRGLVENGGHHGRVITIFSPKGGIGKTTVSTNLAVSFAKYLNKRTLLLDLDLQFGDAAIMLGFQPDKTIYDLVVAPGELDSEKLAGYTATHACGLDIMPAPLQPEDAELITESKLTRLLEVARGSYDIIVVDTSPFFHGPMLATLDRTDELLIICGLDVPTIKNVRLSLQTLELLSFPSERVRTLLNRANTNVGIDRAEVERTLERKIRADLPSDRGVPLGVNRGIPVALADSSAEFSKAVLRLAKELLAEAPAQEKKRDRKDTGRRGLTATLARLRA